MDLDTTNAPGWRPSDGDTIIGRVRGVDRMRSSMGAQEYYPVMTLEVEGEVTVSDGDGGSREQDGGLVAVHAFHSVLRDRLTNLKPQLGERIGIKLIGQKPTKDGNRRVTVYNVKVDRDLSKSDPWAGFNREAPSRAPQSDIPVTDEDFATPDTQDVQDDIPF